MNNRILIPIQNIANGQRKASRPVDNDGIEYIGDPSVFGFIKTGASPSVSGDIKIFMRISENYGASYTGGGTGLEGEDIAADKESELFLLDTIITDGASGKVYPLGVYYLNSFYGGVMPHKWGIVIKNNTGDAFNSLGKNHGLYYTRGA